MIDADEMLTIKEACALIGGSKRPIHFATYYRGVQAGIYPRPVKVSAHLVRVSKRALVETLARMVARDDAAA
jgi:predicted DNA-binding transcriptional regulator AlpA